MNELVSRLRPDWKWFEQNASIFDRYTAMEFAALLEQYKPAMTEAATEIERLTAALASEREACALVAETTRLKSLASNPNVEIASAIRARGKEI